MLTRAQPNPVLLGQGYTQQVLRSHIEKLGGAIETETELRHFEQTADGVDVTLAKHRDGSEAIETARFRYLVGTDGGKSEHASGCLSAASAADDFHR